MSVIEMNTVIGKEIDTMLDGVSEAGAANVCAQENILPSILAGWMAVGCIQELTEDICSVDIRGYGTLAARRAFSCLVVPRTGDWVQLLGGPQGCWIVAVLERSDTGGAVELDVGPSNLVLHAKQVSIQADDQLGLHATRLSSRADVITQQSTQRHTRVSGTDCTHAGNTFVHTERHMGLHAKSAVLIAEALLKVDGGQIHMG